ncbi:protein MCM10 homolog [Megalops cyprinoides]|uniref:protein MCM10 homolog n=1 Tax=Megalops cyprinoides TaxID=118141 RepID=UPI00186566BA|nr:protein MCM10 homolog [Megalops cyprinoides]
MEGEDDLDILTSLLAENEAEEGNQDGQEGADDLEGLFDNDEEEEYDEGPEEEEEETEEEDELSGGPARTPKASDSLHKSRQDLEEKPAAAPRRSNPPKLQESSAFSAQLNNADLLKTKTRTAHQPSPRVKAENKSPVGQCASASLSQPMRAGGKASSMLRSPPPAATAALAPPTARQATPRPPAPQDVAVEKFSGLRLRRPRVSSTEMERKMADRRLIRLSQLPERLAREKLEDSDWVTFAVVVSKATPQSNSSGKTFSIWKLNDLRDLEVYVSLFLFGEVHKEHWKTDPGTVIGILNPNPMKPKEGSDGVCLSVDHPQKVLLMGEALDFGTCKATKKNGDPCSQLVNLYDCQFCQYHVKAQYKKMSSKRAELQSTFSGKAPGRGGGRGSLKERLCQSGFHYGGVSSAACAASLAASQPKKPGQTTLGNLFVRGADKLVTEAKRIAMQGSEVSGCSDDFKGLLSMPTPGALNLKKHLTHTKPSGSAGAGIQSISASELLKQQKQQMLQARKRRAEEIQKRFLQNCGKAGAPRPGPVGVAGSPPLKAGGEGAKGLRSPTGPHTPTLGRGFTEGEDVLFFDHTPPPPPPSHSLSAAKLAALRKLREKGQAIAKEDPNAVKRKRPNNTDIAKRVEQNRASPEGEQAGAEPEEPALKKRRAQLEYLRSDEFQQILNAKSRHTGALQAAEFQLQEQYFDPLVKKEQMEEKMRNIREMKCRAVTCKTCKYTYFKPLDRCVEEKHDYHWHDALKRFFRCQCGQRAISLDRLPHKHCSNCGLFKWERDGMLKEKTGPKIGGELLLPRGEEQPKFLNSMK